MGHQGTLGIVTEATLELVQAPGGRVLGVLRLPRPTRTPGGRRASFARSGVATLAGVVLFDEWKVDVPAPRRRGVHPAARLGAGASSRWPCTATTDEVRASAQADAADRQGVRRRATSATRSPRATGPRGTTATPRRCTGAPGTARSRSMSWHCEDAAINYSQLPAVREKWHADRRPACASASTCSTTGACSPTRTGPSSRGATTSPRSTSASGSRSWDDESWAGVGRRQARDRRASPSSTAARSRACHGSCREGEVDLVPDELGGGFEVMKTDQAHARPEQHHEPGQVPARRGLRGGGVDDRLPALGAEAAGGAAHQGRRRHALRARLRGRPGAHDRAHAASRTSRPGTRSGSSTAAGSTWRGCTTTSPTASSRARSCSRKSRPRRAHSHEVQLHDAARLPARRLAGAHQDGRRARATTRATRPTRPGTRISGCCTRRPRTRRRTSASAPTSPASTCASRRSSARRSPPSTS